MNKAVFFVIALVVLFSGCGSLGPSRDANRQPGPNETAVIIQRNPMPVYAGFKERVYIDGVQKLVLANGAQGRIIVPNGTHTIHADLYTLTSEKTSFTAESGTMGLMTTPYSVYDFAIEPLDEDLLLAAIQNTPAPSVAQAAPVVKEAAPKPAPAAKETPPKPAPARPAAQESPAPPPARTGLFARLADKGRALAAAADNSIESSLLRAAEKIIVKIPGDTRLAIVYVTAKDSEIAEFIANELEFIMVEQDLTLIDRSHLDAIRKEQNFQLSGEVDDDHAVSIGKIAGADVILIGAVTGTGDIRRLRLRALDTQSAQVVVAASERY
jgi:hypothetical protein